MNDRKLRTMLLTFLAALGLIAFAPAAAMAQWGDGIDEPGLDSDDLDFEDDLDIGDDETELDEEFEDIGNELEDEFEDVGDDIDEAWDEFEGDYEDIDEPGLDIDDVDFEDDPDLGEPGFDTDDIDFDDDVDMDDRELMRTRTSLGHLGSAGAPTLEQLVGASSGIAVIRIDETSTALGGECDVFYGATFRVDNVLMGNGVPSELNRIGRAAVLTDDECSLVSSSSDVSPFFRSGERYIIFTGSGWGDVVLPYSMLSDVNRAIMNR